MYDYTIMKKIIINEWKEMRKEKEREIRRKKLGHD
jgi:hypothetical protein